VCWCRWACTDVSKQGHIYSSGPSSFKSPWVDESWFKARPLVSVNTLSFAWYSNVVGCVTERAFGPWNLQWALYSRRSTWIKQPGDGHPAEPMQFSRKAAVMTAMMVGGWAVCNVLPSPWQLYTIREWQQDARRHETLQCVKSGRQRSLDLLAAEDTRTHTRTYKRGHRNNLLSTKWSAKYVLL